MNISHFYRQDYAKAILPCIAADMPLQLAAVTFSRTCSPLHLPMIREAFRFVLSPLRVQHSFRGETQYVGKIAVASASGTKISRVSNGRESTRA